jgi:hypothetical protein
MPSLISSFISDHTDAQIGEFMRVRDEEKDTSNGEELSDILESAAYFFFGHGSEESRNLPADVVFDEGFSECAPRLKEIVRPDRRRLHYFLSGDDVLRRLENQVREVLLVSYRCANRILGGGTLEEADG